MTPARDDARGPAAHHSPRIAPALLGATERAVADALRLEGPADAALRTFFRAHPKLGRRERGLIAETTFDVLRHRRRYAHLAQGLRGALPRRLAALSVASRLGVAALDGWRLAPAETDALRAALATDPAGLPQPVRLSLPDWLHAALLEQAAAGGEPDPAAQVERIGQSLLEVAPLDLRVNLLKADRDSVRAELAGAGIEAEPLDVPATALRLRGRPAIDQTRAFERGAFEVQDAGSQQLVAFAGPRRGQTVVDFCAGAGGKTLAIAAAMRSSGQVFACDVSAARLARLGPRLARSGASNVQPMRLEHENDPKLGRLAGRADLVLVDAPCSGTGTLRRNPELKWRMQPTSIDELQARQTAILAAAARLVAKGGALVYATCSLLRAENEAVAEAFAEAHPGFDPPVFLRLRPDLEQTDGFFAARWVRRE